jgi:phasin family protein
MATKTAAKPVKTVEAATEQFEQFTAASQEKFREGVDKSLAAMSEFNAFGKENVEAWVASATATTKGLEALSARAVAYSKAAMEDHVAATKSIMGAKSVQEAMERQSDYARKAFDGYVAELNKMSDMMSGLTKDAFKPLNERFTAVSALVQAGMKNGAVR